MPDILYHYCTTGSFYSIVQSRSVRLSSMLNANDSLEGKLVARALDRLAKSDGLSTTERSNIADNLAVFEATVDGLAFCLSANGDLLSQWRGYAGDATGVCIGFSMKRLNDLVALHHSDLTQDEAPEDAFFIGLHRARYTDQDHETEVRPIYEQARYFAMKDADPSFSREQPVLPEDIRRRGVGSPSSLGEALLFLFYKMFILKTNAFQAEEEWRLISYSVRGISDHAKFYAADRKLVPYRLVNISRIPGAIQSVVLGPKHETPPHLIQQFLAQHGFGKVDVVKSRASYR